MVTLDLVKVICAEVGRLSAMEGFVAIFLNVSDLGGDAVAFLCCVIFTVGLPVSALLVGEDSRLMRTFSGTARYSTIIVRTNVSWDCGMIHKKCNNEVRKAGQSTSANDSTALTQLFSQDCTSQIDDSL